MDNDNKEFTFAIPNNKLEDYVYQIRNKNGYVRGAHDDKCPS